MNNQIRLLLAIAASMGIMALWQIFLAEPPPPPSEPPAALDRPATPADQPTPGGDAPDGVVEPPEEDAPESFSDVSTSLWEARFSTRGGALASFRLLGEKHEARQRGRGERDQVDLVQVLPTQPLPLSTVLVDYPAFGPDAAYRLVSRSDDEIVFARSRGGVTLTKRYTWTPGSYVVGLSVELGRTDGQGGDYTLQTLVTGYEPPEEAPGFFSSLFSPRAEGQQGVCHIEGERSVETLASASIGEESPAGRAGFVGVDRKYFIAGVAPAEEGVASICRLSVPRPGELVATLSRPVSLSAGGAGRVEFDTFLGPKDVDLLMAAGHEFERAVDFGFFAVVSRLLLTILKLFESFVGNWGVAIILLTVLVKVLTFPLTHKQMISMEGMRKLAPKMEEIRKRYGGDQQRVNTETMKLYRENNVNPMGGCLPMLVQMPVWFALYTTLSTSFDLYNEPFISGWIDDLTSKDPYYVTPLLMVATMFLTQVLTPQPQANQQMKIMMYTMPIVFGFIMLTLPSGLVLYIFTNNLLSIAQSLWFRRKYGVDAPAAAGGR